MSRLQVKIASQTSQATTIAGAAILTVSAVALLVPWGLLSFLAFTELAEVSQPPLAVHPQQKIICTKENPRILTPGSRRAPPRTKLDNLRSLQQKLHQRAQSLRVPLREGLDRSAGAEPSTIADDLESYQRQFLTVLRADPQAALALMPTEETQQAFQEISENCLPKPFAAEGTAEVFHADDFKNQRSATAYTLRTGGGERYVLHPVQPFDDVESGTKIALKTAFETNGEVLVTRHAILAQPGNPPVVGPQRVATILTQPTVTTSYGTSQALPAPPYSKEQMAGVVFGRVGDFYRQNSYGQISLVGANGTPGSAADVYGPYPIKFNITYSCSEDSARSCNPQQADACPAAAGECEPYCPHAEIFQAAVQAAGSGVPFQNYQRLVVALPSGIDCPWAGFATYGKVTITPVNAAPLEVSEAVVMATGGGGFDLIVAHELGHNFNLGHAKFLKCPDAENVNPDCIEEYGDPYDVMGEGNLYHSNAVLKGVAGWMTPDLPHQALTVTRSETYTLKPLGDSAGGIQTLRIPHAARAWRYLNLEWRKPTDNPADLDSRLYAWYDLRRRFGQPVDVFDGALIHFGSGSLNSSALFDPLLRGNQYTTALKPGASFTDPSSGSTVTVGAMVAAGMPVTVDLQRTDFDGPTNLQLVRTDSGDPCKPVYVASAEDPAGISLIEFYRRPVWSGVGEIIGAGQQSPTQVTVDLLSGADSYLWFRAYDNAKVQGGNAPNNFTESEEVKISGSCTPEYPEITIISPGNLDTPWTTIGKQYVDIKPTKSYELQFPGPVRNPLALTAKVLGNWPLSIVKLFDTNTATFECSKCTSCIPNVCYLHDENYIGANEYEFTLTRPFQPGKHLLILQARVAASNTYRVTEVSIAFEVLPPESLFLRGDTNGDHGVDLADAIATLEYLYLDGSLPACADAADANDNGSVDLSDAIKTLLALYAGQEGGEFPDPGTVTAGPDPTEDALRCYP